MSNPALNKIAPNSPSRQKPNEVETNIANALHDLETNIPDMRGPLRPLNFVSAREVRQEPLHMKRSIYTLCNLSASNMSRPSHTKVVKPVN